MGAISSDMRCSRLLFEELPSEATLASIAERVKYQRVARFMAARKQHQSIAGSCQELSAATALFRGLEALAKYAGHAALEILHGWPVGHFLLQNDIGPAERDAAYARVIADLLFVALPNGDSPLAGLSFAVPVGTDGAVPVLGLGGRLYIDGVTPSSGSLVWRCSARSACVSGLDDGMSPVVLALPLGNAAAPSCVFKANPVAAGFDLPVIDDRAGTLFHVGMADAEERGAADQAACDGTLALAESLGRAHDLIQAVWPGVITWLRALAPAFVDVGVNAGRATRLSGSFAPGEPIYLSRVNDPMCHAEDVIHELQHLRFMATIPAGEWFGRWGESATRFVSPYRSDLRPLAGIHLGLHAFVLVTEFRLQVMDRPDPGRTSVSWLLDTHFRNVFALRTIARHEALSAAGQLYYCELGAILARQHSRIEAAIPISERERVLDAIGRSGGAAAGREIAENAGIALAQSVSADEIAAMIQ